MKKAKLITISKDSANTIAHGLKKSMGPDKAYKVADYYAKTLANIGTGDCNADIFTMKEIGKTTRIWTQVRNILAK